jgi:hypothetical protein
VTRKGDDRGGKHESGSRGDGLSPDRDGEILREDENQEGIGPCATLNKRCRGTDSRREQSPEDGLPDETRGMITLERRRVRPTYC